MAIEGLVLMQCGNSNTHEPVWGYKVLALHYCAGMVDGHVSCMLIYRMRVVWIRFEDVSGSIGLISRMVWEKNGWLG